MTKAVECGVVFGLFIAVWSAAMTGYIAVNPPVSDTIPFVSIFPACWMSAQLRFRITVSFSRSSYSCRLAGVWTDKSCVFTKRPTCFIFHATTVRRIKLHFIQLPFFALCCFGVSLCPFNMDFWRLCFWSHIATCAKCLDPVHVVI